MRTFHATRALRDANAAFKKIECKKAITDYAKEQQSIQENRERLKMERLDREAKMKADVVEALRPSRQQ
ncbi:hypothetical protein [Bradyrhizobium sp. CB3481]|uniref:hypothetical protein n=1 Tax=Bradyrhizobium sp. CB3481 TaxID=3039158 RepID=UPI0024B0AA09|nr:hypothetical protein [Bradyrhizobium sp. CB3481]WFU19972.1 hypothetical protein QA643_17405 [Bradyrhizobium sp. CB3481]